MKKSVYLGIIALATMSLASCSIDDTIMSVPDAEAIEFGTYLGRGVTTRGKVFDDAAMKATGAGFGVFAFYTGQTAWKGETEATTPNFMYNQNVTWNGSAWAYTPKKYWPTTDGDKITFFAYAPMPATNNGITVSENTKTGTPTVTYEIDNTALENMADFVADARIDQQRTTGTTSSDVATNVDDEAQPVSFGLNHELTRVNIKAKLSTDAYSSSAAANKTKVNITDIMFYGDGFATEGTYTFAQTNDDATTTPATIKRGSWNYTGVGNAAVSIFDKGETTANFINKATDTELNAANYSTVGVAVPTTAEVAVFNAKEYLFLIPPTEGGVTAEKKVTMLVEYDIVTADASLSAGHSKTSATKVIPLPAGVLKQGVAYNFVLTFGLNEVTLDAEVAGWGNETDNPHNVDWPKGDAL